MIAFTETAEPLWCGDLREAAALPGAVAYTLACRERQGEMVYLAERGRVGTWWELNLRWWEPSTPEAALVELGKGCGCG